MIDSQANPGKLNFGVRHRNQLASRGRTVQVHGDVTSRTSLPWQRGTQESCGDVQITLDAISVWRSTHARARACIGVAASEGSIVCGDPDYRENAPG